MIRTQLVSSSFEDGLMLENIGIGRIKSYLDKYGKYVEVVHLESPKIEECIKDIDMSCDIIGLSMYSNNLDLLFELAKRAKNINPNIIIICGSKFVTSFYEDVLERDTSNLIDLIVLGDGESAMLKIIELCEQNADLKQGLVNEVNIVWKNNTLDKRPVVLNVASLPWPDRSYLIKNQRVAALIADAQGCIGNCSFCSVKDYHKGWDGRTAEDIFCEIKWLHNNTNARFFIFTSGSFDDPGEKGKKKIEELCKMILDEELKISFRCFMRTESFKDTDQDRTLLMLMKQAGFNEVYLGLESGNEEDLKIFNKRATLLDNETALRIFKEADIYVGSFGFIMLNPYSTSKSLRENYYFLAKQNEYKVFNYTTQIIAYKNTQLYERMLKDCLIASNSSAQQYFGIHKYKYMDNKVASIADFLKENFNQDIIGVYTRNAYLLPTLIHSFYRFWDDGDKRRDQLNSLINEQATILKSYFYHLYVEQNIEYCKSNISFFISQLNELNKRFDVLITMCFKRLVKHHKMKL